LWEVGLPDDATVRAEDLLHGYTYWWHGKVQHVDLSPEEPYRVWRLSRS
jgi:starch synthase (maltosyl-transferring)